MKNPPPEKPHPDRAAEREHSATQNHSRAKY